MSSISKNSAITFSSQILISIIGIIATAILARALGPTGKGIYTLIILIPAVLVKLGTLGIEVSNVYFTGNRKYEVKELVSNSLISGISLGVILILLFWGISHLGIFQKFLNSSQINPFYLWLVVFTVPISLFFSFLISVILGIEKIIEFNKINIFHITLELIGTIIFVLLLKQGVLGATFSYVLGVIGATLFVIFLIRKMTKVQLSLNKNLLKDSVVYGGKAYFGNVAQFLNYRLDMFLVAIFLTPAEVGFYSIAVGLAEKLWMLPGAIAVVLFPRISSLESSQANVLTPKVSRHTFFITFVLSLFLGGISKPLIRFLFGNAFLPSVIPLLILLPGIIALGGAKIMSADLAGRGKPEISALASFISLGVTIALDLLLIPKWGISGAAFASTVAYASATIIVIGAFTKVSKKSWSETLIIKPPDFQSYNRLFSRVKSISSG